MKQCSSIVNEVSRAIISLLLLFFFIKRFYMQKKNTNKKHTSRYVFKLFKKRVVYLLVCFFKAFKRKKSAYKKSGRKLLITSWALFFVHLFYAYKKYLEQFITS